MIVVGLTGGIASGKSSVSAIFKKAGAMIIDADRIARDVVLPGLPAWCEIRDLFGEAILNPDRTLNRAALGQRVFGDAGLRRRLEQIIHPHIFKQITEKITLMRHAQPDAVVIVDIPLLYETGMIHGFDEIIVVYAHPAFQLKRLMERDSMDIETAYARLNAQMPISEKCRQATIIIWNSGHFADVEQEVLKIYAGLAERN